MKNDKKELNLYTVLLVGFAAGVINGLLGAGGGILITYFLYRLMKDGDSDKNDVFAHALLTMLPVSLVSFIIYACRGYLSVDSSLFYLALPAIVGGAGGAYLLTKIKFKVVRFIFIGLVIYSGLSMLF